MKIDTIEEMWDEDKQLDLTDLTGETMNSPVLHHKYYKLYTQQNLKLQKMLADFKILRRDLTSYYKGEMDQYELDERGWNPQPLKILRQDIKQTVDDDDEIIKFELKVAYQDEMVKKLKDILTQISNRRWDIKNIIDYEKFKAGAL